MNDIDPNAPGQAAVENPYLAPGAPLSGATSDVYQPRLLQWKGRIGRLRYLAYLSVVCLLTAVGMMILGAVLGAVGMNMSGGRFDNLMMAYIAVVYAPMVVFSFVLARRRFNDAGRSGWFSVLLFVPFVNLLVSLYLVFAQGSEGANAYGLPPAPNTLWIKIAGSVLPLLFVIGIVASVAIPAYVAVKNAGGGGSNSSSF